MNTVAHLSAMTEANYAALATQPRQVDVLSGLIGALQSMSSRDLEISA